MCRSASCTARGGLAALHLIEMQFDRFGRCVSRIDRSIDRAARYSVAAVHTAWLHPPRALPCLLRREDAFEERIAVVLERAAQRRAELRRHDELGHIGLWYVLAAPVG